MSFGTELAAQLDHVAGSPALPQYKSGAGSVTGAKQRIAYILNPRTGASVARVALLAGVTPATVRAWKAGRTPSRASRAKIEKVYRRFYETNNRVHLTGKAKKALSAVNGDALHVFNTSGGDRYWKPQARWRAFVAKWSHGDITGIDKDWEDVVLAWDYPEPWMPDLITEVQIV